MIPQISDIYTKKPVNGTAKIVNDMLTSKQ